MTEAEKAYKEAERLIAKAKRDGATHLNLDTPQTHSLTRLPPEISTLTAITELYLDNTQITDLSPLAPLTALTNLSLGNTRITDLTPLTPLTALTELWLRGTGITDVRPLSLLTTLTRLNLINTPITDLRPLTLLTALIILKLDDTQITDLRPLRLLSGFAESPDVSGLSFSNTPATRADPRIAEIAEIIDSATRARELFAYLETWVPPVPEDLPDAPSYVVPDQGPITSRLDPPEDGDEDQEALRQDLSRKASVLIEAIGASNELSILSAAARHYQTQIAKALPLIRLNLLYSAANSLRVAFEANEHAVAESRYSDKLPPITAAALADLVQTHALFFMGFPNAADIHAKMLAGLTGTRNPSLVVQAEPLVHSLENKPTVLDPEDQQAMADDLAGAKGAGPSAEIADKRLVGQLTNMLGAIGRKAYFVGKAAVATVLKRDLIAFLLDEKLAISRFLTYAYGQSPAWFVELVKWLGRLLTP